MATFSPQSLGRLGTCHEDLQRLFMRVVNGWDCTVLEGHRDKAAQNEAFRTGRSKLQWPNGNHNKKPSLAVDVAPYPIDWQDWKRFYAFGGYVLGIADHMGIGIRWGGDWNGNRDFADQSFNDLPHFELEAE